jgi:hypothetical protein
MDRIQSRPSRRSFLKSFTFAGVSMSMLSSSRLFAGTTCNAYRVCVSQVDFAEFAQDAFDTQHMSEWCWAACISMLFSFYGHTVSQERIVSEVYGHPVNMPAGYGVVIARQLNRVWKDDDGNRFRATLTGAYDHDAQINTLNNAMLISELDNDHPIIIGSGSHAMVLTAIQYTPAMVTALGVFDPWPGRGARDLTPAEIVPIERGGALRFLATARITDL